MAARKRAGRTAAPAPVPDVEAYFAAQPRRTRVALRKLREAIRSAAPGAVESFSYRMPGFKLDGKALVWYAGWAEHTALYPITGAIQAGFADELARFERSTGTIRFPLDHALPVALIKRLVKARMTEVRAPRSRVKGASRGR